MEMTSSGMRARTAIFVAVLTCGWLLGNAIPSHAALPLETGVSPYQQTTQAFKAFEQTVGKKQQYFLFYSNWSYDIPIDTVKGIRAMKSTPIVTWEPMGLNLDDILGATTDAYIRRNARNLKTVPGAVLLRPMHEMNGGYYSWGYGKPGNTPEKARDAFRHIVTLFREEGATNVKFVWSPNNNGPPGPSPKWIPLYFPGDAYIDYAGLNAFNFGTTFPWSYWYVFPRKLDAPYREAVKISARPIIIIEAGSVETGGDKARWITSLYAITKKSYPRVKAVIWFDWVAQAADYRVTSSPASLAAFRTQMSRLALPARPIEIDPSPPTGRFMPPLSHKRSFRKKTGSVLVQVAAKDNIRVAHVRFYLDGKLKRTDKSAKYSWKWRIKSMRPGKHRIKAVISDVDGNRKTITKTVTIKK